MKLEAGKPAQLPDGTFLNTAKAKVYDCVGQVIPYVISYDTETKEVEVVMKIEKKEGRLGLGGFLFTETDAEDDSPFGKRKLATLKGVVKGSYCEVDGVRIA